VADEIRPTRLTTPDPVVGWRIWKLETGRLASLVVDYRWEPGENRARCLPLDHVPCIASPGFGCLCGFWAVWSLRHSLGMACPAVERPWQVMGLVAGWGTVALHGSEGFRAERAAVRCLFTDLPFPWPSPMSDRLATLWRRAVGRGEPAPAPVLVPADQDRVEALRGVAALHSVPLVSLRDAVGVGLLGELGLSAEMVAEAVSVCESASSVGTGGPSQGP
jgi:hypothetical protein